MTPILVRSSPPHSLRFQGQNLRPGDVSEEGKTRVEAGSEFLAQLPMESSMSFSAEGKKHLKHWDRVGSLGGAHAHALTHIRA